MVHYRPKSPTSAYHIYLYLQAKIGHKANQTRAAKPIASPLLAVQATNEEHDSEQDEREVRYSSQAEEGQSGASIGNRSHKERLTMAKTRLGVLEASLEELY
ncbi:hypothetical protein BHE74_00051620 [Ensete ventricosum]|nr:hypothetical protein BHE74_00051620 [Ensete ventricosum]